VRVILPEDNWAELKDAADLTGEDEVKVKSAVRLDVPTGTGENPGLTTSTAAAPLMEYAMLARVITSWSLPQPITVATVSALRLSYLRPLKKAIEEHMAELRDDPNPTSGGQTATA